MSSQHIMLEALEEAVFEAVADGRLDDGVFDNEPRSHVFYPEPGEPWDEDDMAAIKAVGQQDLSAKIAYYSRLLDTATRRIVAPPAKHFGLPDYEPIEMLGSDDAYNLGSESPDRKI